jgi:hypothetical protein
MALRFASTMKAELLDDEEEFDALLDELEAPNALAAPDPDVLLAPEPALADALPAPAVTASPTAPEIEAIVPALGAYSLVPASADSSL